MRGTRAIAWMGAAAVMAGVLAVLALQRLDADVTRREVELGREQMKELAQVRTENARLKAEQVSAADLARAQADAAEARRLRAEIESLIKGADRRKR